MTQLREMILNPSCKIHTPGNSYPENHLRNLVKQATPSLLINNVSQYYWQSEKDEWDAADFPNMAPPFPFFWAEYKMPKKIHADGEYGYHKIKNHYIGVLVDSHLVEELSANTHIPEDVSSNKWIVSFFMFMGIKKLNSVSFTPLTLSVGINKNGTLGYFGEKRAWAHGVLAKMNQEDQSDFSDMMSVFVKPFLLAISFLHCKNVEMEERQIITRKLQRKKKKPEDKYYVLKIDPMKRILETEGNSKSTGLKNALHICRGHFKDFRGGSGLFGKHKNIFWWNSQVRGSKTAGTITKDYEINNVNR